MYASPQAEERRFARVPSGEAVRMQFTGDDALVAGSLENVSVGGAYVRCASTVAVGRELKCAFFVVTHGEPRLVCCHARVAWVAAPGSHRPRAPGFGVCFTLYHHDSFDSLRTFTKAMVV